MENVLLHTSQRDYCWRTHVLLRVGSHNSATYAKKLSDQKVWLPTIPGWSSKQRYFRRHTNDEVVQTLLNHDEVHRDSIKELDKQAKSLGGEVELPNKDTDVSTPASKRHKSVEHSKGPNE